MMDFVNTAILLCGLLVAWRTLIAHRELSAKRAALDFVAQFEVHPGPEWPNIVMLAIEAIDNRKIWGPLVTHEPGSDGLSEEQVKQKFALMSWLNHMEFIATAIHTGALDRDFYLTWYGKAYKKYWNRSSECIRAYRASRSNSSAFVEFEKLAQSIG